MAFNEFPVLLRLLVLLLISLDVYAFRYIDVYRSLTRKRCFGLQTIDLDNIEIINPIESDSVVFNKSSIALVKKDFSMNTDLVVQRQKFKLDLIALLFLVIQNSSLAIVMRWSRIISTPTKTYIASSAVVMNELMKLVFSIIGYYFISQKSYLLYPKSSEKNNNEQSESLMQKLNQNIDEFQIMSIPAVLYVFQNNMQYLATSNLPVQAYQVLIQMKLLTTTFFSSVLLKKSQSPLQWLSIINLTIGIIFIQFSLVGNSGLMKSKLPVHGINLYVGLVSVIASCLTSGYAGVYHEKTLKTENKNSNLWIRNVQMSLISLALAAMYAIIDYKRYFSVGFFHGYSPIVWIVIFLQAIGGIAVSVVIKQTSSIVKGFATTASIILSCVLSSILLNDMKMTSQFIVGTTIVCASALLYSFQSMTIAKQKQEISSTIEVSKISQNSSFNYPTEVFILSEEEKLMLELPRVSS
eukprot:gene9239-12453_t